MEGRTQESRSLTGPTVIPGDGNAGILGGGTYTGQGLEPTLQDWENIFGPASRNIKSDPLADKRRVRLHLPDVLRGPNNWIADRIDGLISDATNSPFTSLILPYMYIENPDQQLSWAVWSFDEGLSSRVPYESAARVLTQTKKSFKAYAVRHGLAITMEHNFMMSPKGRENFQNQLKQLVGSIQYSNDLDVHIALVTAPSYAKQWMEKYSSSDKTTHQICREYVDLFGMIQKNPNGLDILIEDAKATLKLWGSPPPTFMLSNAKLLIQLTMTPEKTSYITNGIDGVKRLRQGPDIGSYRGLSIINTRQFSMETGAIPRDILRRRVRVAEYYRIPPQPAHQDWCVELYDEARDTWFTMTRAELDKAARLDNYSDNHYDANADTRYSLQDYLDNHNLAVFNDAVDIMWPDPRNWKCKLYKPRNFDLFSGIPENWGAIHQALTQLQGGIYAQDFHYIHYRDILQNLQLPYLQPNNNLGVHEALAANATPVQAAAWAFTQAALLEKTCRFLWKKIDIAPQFIHDSVLPFLFQDPTNARASFNATLTVLNPYNTVLTLGLFATLTPNLDDRETVYDAFRKSGVHFSNVRAAVSQYMRQIFKPNAYTTRIQMGRILENIITNAFPNMQFQDRDSLFNIWPNEVDRNNQSICARANMLENTTTLGNPAIETAYNQHQDFRFNRVARPGREVVCENDEHVVGVFFLTMCKRFWSDMSNMTRDQLFPRLLPFSTLQDTLNAQSYEYVILRPCIEHNMLGVIMGRGGSEELGATLWGQTELSCYDDAFHGVWGMSYKYHERALVFNERNLIRLWDVAYDGYNGGKDDTIVDWTEEARGRARPFHQSATDMSVPYRGPSLMVMRFKVDRTHKDYRSYWPSPIVFHDNYLNREPPKISPDPDSCYVVQDADMRVFNKDIYREQYRPYHERMPDFSYFHQVRKPPGQSSIDMETHQNALAFQGTYKVKALPSGTVVTDVAGSGHHGPDWIGVASVRSGKGMKTPAIAPNPMRIV